MKELKTNMGKRKKGAKGTHGQVTIFIIIALVIVAIGVLVYMFYPKIKTTFALDEETPEKFIQTCLQDDIQESVDRLSLQGGSISPSHYILYKDEKVEYLCYQEEYYLTCVVQQPMLKRHIESEIENELRDRVRVCFDQLEQEYKNKGYEVGLRRGQMQAELLPKRIVLSFNSTLSLVKGESSQRTDSFRVILNNNLYELVSIANSILEWETRYGKIESTWYMGLYHDLQVAYAIQSDGSKVYILTDMNNGNKFQFAVRSVVWPPGYG